MKDYVYIPPKTYHHLKGHPYYADFERHIGRTLPKAHRDVISQLESLRFHHLPIRAVITQRPPESPVPESSSDGEIPLDPLQELILQYARWIINHIFRDHDDPFDPMICCIGRRMDHTRYMIRHGLQYKVMNANVVNWTRRAIPGSLYNPALPAHERSLHIIYSDRLTAEHLPHLLHIEAEYVAPPEAPKAPAASATRRRGLQRLEDPIVYTNIYTLEAFRHLASYKEPAALAGLYHFTIDEVHGLLAKIARDGPF